MPSTSRLPNSHAADSRNTRTTAARRAAALASRRERRIDPGAAAAQKNAAAPTGTLDDDAVDRASRDAMPAGDPPAFMSPTLARTGKAPQR